MELGPDKPPVRSEGDRAGEAAPRQAPDGLVIGRRPNPFQRIAARLPQGAPVVAGAGLLLAAIVALALMSPSGENAAADGVRSGRVAPAEASANLALEGAAPATRRARRDPFKAKGYQPPPDRTKRSAARRAKARKAAVRRAMARRAAKRRADARRTKLRRKRAAARRMAMTLPLAAALATRSPYTPRRVERKLAGSWIDFADTPTLRVIEVGESWVRLFVVTNVEVNAEKSTRIRYDGPTREITIGRGGVLHLSDFRPSQAEPPGYTVRFLSSRPAAPTGGRR